MRPGRRSASRLRSRPLSGGFPGRFLWCGELCAAQRRRFDMAPIATEPAAASGAEQLRGAAPAPARRGRGPLGRRQRAVHTAAAQGRVRHRPSMEGSCDHPPLGANRSDASSSGEDTPLVAAAVLILWCRFGEALPLCRPLRSRPRWRVRAAASWCRVRTSPLGHSLGQTLPYWAVPGPTPGI